MEVRFWKWNTSVARAHRHIPLFFHNEGKILLKYSCRLVALVQIGDSFARQKVDPVSRLRAISAQCAHRPLHRSSEALCRRPRRQAAHSRDRAQGQGASLDFYVIYKVARQSPPTRPATLTVTLSVTFARRCTQVTLPSVRRPRHHTRHMWGALRHVH